MTMSADLSRREEFRATLNDNTLRVSSPSANFPFTKTSLRNQKTFLEGTTFFIFDQKTDRQQLLLTLSYTLLIWVARGGGRERPMREAVHRTHSHSAERPPQHKHSPPEAQELGQGGGAPSQAAATFPPFVIPSKHCSPSHPTHVALDIKLSTAGRVETTKQL